ncbi:uncharacterized protein [Antedon mediterranea]|uniref:uncharacterized protein n=1 Tax=Antedon mediterranea TaxID=105859 RepID=UPI003AF74028
MSSTKRKQNKPQRSLELCVPDETSGHQLDSEVPQSTRRSSRIVSKMMAKNLSPPSPLKKAKKKPQTPSKKGTKKKIVPSHSGTKSKKSKLAEEESLNVDLLRRLPVTELVDKYAIHTTKQIPKDRSSTIIQHEYSCQMMPHNCREVFCGSASDTKEEIRRHLLRHIGELLTLSNLDPDSKRAKDTVNITAVKRPLCVDSESSETSPQKHFMKESENEDEQDATKQGRRSERILAKVLHSDSKHIDDKFTIIHSDEGVNELVFLPKGRLINLSSTSETPNKPEDADIKIPRQTVEEQSLSVNNVIDLPKEEVKLGRPPKSLQRDISSESSEFIFDLPIGENCITEEINADNIGAEIVVQTYMQGTADDLIAMMEVVPLTPPHVDHVYALLPTKPLPTALHTDSSGMPIPEPEITSQDYQDYQVVFQEEEVVEEERLDMKEKPFKSSTADIDSVEIVTDFDMDNVCQDVGLTKGKKKRKQDPQLAVINYELFQHLTPDERRIRKQALELLYQSRKRSRIRKGELLECEICGKMLTAFGTLRAHYRSHAGIKPYSCKVCSATFTRLHSLKYHMMIHNDQSRFTCEHCGREFRHASHFREHLRRHTGEEPFGCTECSARFKTRNTYKRHLYAKHGKVLKTDGIHLAKTHKMIDKVEPSPVEETEQKPSMHDNSNALLMPSDSQLNVLAQIAKEEKTVISTDQEETEDIASCLASLSEITNPLRDMEGNIRILLIN